MKKVLIVFLSLLTLCISASLVASYYILDIAKKNNQEIEKNITKMKAVLIHQEELVISHDNLLSDLEVSSKAKYEELSIWRKAEEKLNNALK